MPLYGVLDGTFRHTSEHSYLVCTVAWSPAVSDEPPLQAPAAYHTQHHDQADVQEEQDLPCSARPLANEATTATGMA